MSNNSKHDPELAERLKKLRIEHKYSYQKLEELTGISRSSLQRYENGLNTNLTSSKLTILADAYGVPPTYLLGWESKDLPYDKFRSLLPLLEECGYTIKYHGSDESFTLESVDASYPITVEQINLLKDSAISYLKFRIYDSILKPPADE